MLDERFIKEDFYDDDHLNMPGAAKLSKMIDSIIVQHK